MLLQLYLMPFFVPASHEGCWLFLLVCSVLVWAVVTSHFSFPLWWLCQEFCRGFVVCSLAAICQVFLLRARLWVLRTVSEVKSAFLTSPQVQVLNSGVTPVTCLKLRLTGFSHLKKPSRVVLPLYAALPETVLVQRVLSDWGLCPLLRSDFFFLGHLSLFSIHLLNWCGGTHL